MRPMRRPPPTKSTSAAILGPMLPGSNCPSAWCLRASASVMRSSQRCVGLLKSSATFSTPVGSTRMSAAMLRASRLEARSLSMTASTPRSSPPSSSITGMPPPPQATTTKPWAARFWMTAVSRMACGLGEGTTRRHPRPASSRTLQWYFFASCFARASSMCEPIRFGGVADARAWAVARRRRTLSRARVSKVGADRLGRVGERRVVAVDQSLRHDARRLALDAPALEHVAPRLEEHVADRALDIGAGIVHRHRRHLGDGKLRAAQDEADLGTVAVRHHDLPAAFDHARDVLGERAHHLVLVE